MLVRSTSVGHCSNTICISEQHASLQQVYLELGVHVCTGGQKHFGDIYGISSLNKRVEPFKVAFMQLELDWQLLRQSHASRVVADMEAKGP